MDEPKWLRKEMVIGLHAMAVAEFGGAPGLRDESLLESALDRPRNLFASGDEPSLFELAAAYCSGIVKNHPFIDGNKRAGDLAIRAFLRLNGYLYEPEEAEEVVMIVALAAGEVDEAVLAVWIAENATAIGENS